MRRTAPRSPENGWFVVRSKPRREKWAEQNLIQQQAEVYVPRIAPKEVLFPSYLFVRTPDGRWRHLTGTFGVASVVMVGDHPAVLAPAGVAQVRAMEGTDGLVVLPDPPPFAPGEEVEIIGGLFVGEVALFSGMRPDERIQVLIEVLGRKTSVELAVGMVEKRGRR